MSAEFDVEIFKRRRDALTNRLQPLPDSLLSSLIPGHLMGIFGVYSDE